MGHYVTFDLNQYVVFVQKLREASQEIKDELPLFLEGLGLEFLRIVQDEIIRREVVDTRLLLAGFEIGSSDNIFEVAEGDLTVTVGTNVTYAAFRNDGHWANPQGVEQRFIPGRWQGDRFIYEPGAKTGMVLRQQWIEGAHYWESAIRILEQMMPELLMAKMQSWLDSKFE